MSASTTIKTPTSKRKHVDTNEAMEKLRKLSSAEQRTRIENGKVTFKGRTMHVNGFRLILANNCSIIGDSNHVKGHNNVLYGDNNTADGGNNTFKTKAEAPKSKKAVAPTPAAPPPVADVGSEDAEVAQLISRIMGQNNDDDDEGENIDDEDDDDDDEEVIMARIISQRAVSLPAQSAPVAPPPTVSQVDSQVAKDVMPTIGVDPKRSVWKASVLDLTGEAKPTTIEDLQCVVCFTNRKDTLFEPCHHMPCCRACAKKLFVHNGAVKCPECRAHVAFSSIVY